MLAAFNEGDYLKTNDLNSELLRADLERIYESELAVAKNVHTKKAALAPFTGVNMTLDEYIGEIPKFEPDYTSSTFYQEGLFISFHIFFSFDLNFPGKSEKFVADFAAIQPSFDYRKIYEFYYNQKMDEAKSRIERERELKLQAEKDYHADIERALELSRFNLQRHISMFPFFFIHYPQLSPTTIFISSSENLLSIGTLAFSVSLTKAADDFIENKKALEERGKEFNHTPDWSPYYKYYEQEKKCVSGLYSLPCSIYFVINPIRNVGSSN